MKRLLISSPAVFTCLPGVVWGHAGHGVTPPDAPQHYVLEPIHSLPVVLIALSAVGLWGVSRLVRKRATSARDERRRT